MYYYLSDKNHGVNVKSLYNFQNLKMESNYTNCLPFIFIPGDKKNLKIKVTKADIRFIAGNANYIKIYTDTKQHMTYLSLRDILVLLGGDCFVRVHKSYIVNMNKISSIDGISIYMECGELIPIGAAFKEAFLKKIAPV